MKGKRIKAAKAAVDRNKLYELDAALEVLLGVGPAKFDESVDLAIRMGVDPRKSDQMVRGTVVLPNGTGKTVRVLVFAKGDKEKEAQEAGADLVGAEDMVKKIQEGWLDFDKAIATPDMMGQVGRLGKILGPRGMMPNPKLGTVTQDVARAVRELKGGKIEFKVDKGANVHCPIGRRSFGKDKLKANILALFEALNKAKPDTAKGTYVKNFSISTTMGAGIKVDPQTVKEIVK